MSTLESRSPKEQYKTFGPFPVTAPPPPHLCGQVSYSSHLGKHTIRTFFLRKNCIFFVFSSHLETSHFSYRGSVNGKPHLQSNESQ